MSQKLAGEAMKKLSAKSLEADFAPLLESDSWLGRNIVSLAEALRHLDDSEIEALVRLLPDESHHREIADSLLLLKTDAERPVRDVLPEVYEQLWQSAVKRSVETALKALASGGSAGAASSFLDFEIDPFKKTDAKTGDAKNESKDLNFKFDLKEEDLKIVPTAKSK
jgi:hypothetical protein